MEVMMSGTSVGVRELKSQLSRYLRRVKTGETIIITDHGKPIARLVPEPLTLEEKMQRLIDAGLAEWNGKKPEIVEPVVANTTSTLASDLVVEMRK
jgi:prevent-host-death family protein